MGTDDATPELPPGWARRLSRIERRLLARRRTTLRRPTALAEPLGDRPPVYFLLNSAWGMGGTIRTVLNTAGELARRGYPVRVISVMRKKGEPFFPFPPGVRVEALADRTLAGDGRPSRVARRARAQLMQVPSGLYPEADWTYSSHSLLSDARLLWMLRRLPPGVLVTTRPGLNVLAARVAPSHLITIGQEHTAFVRHPDGLRREMLDSYPALDAFLVLTDSAVRDYEPVFAGTATRLLRLPNAVSDLGSARCDPAAPVIVSAGRLQPAKGFDRLLTAFAGASAQHPEWRLRIYGDGYSRPALEAQLERLGIGDRAELLPRTDDIAAALAGASIYALPSRFEGFGLVLVEAMSCGLACVAFDCPDGPRDIVDHEANGLLVPRDKVRAFRAALERLMGDQELRERLGRAALDTADTYSLRSVGDRWEEFLGELVAAHDPTGAT